METVILVVDDDVANLTVARKILGEKYRIAAANSGKAVFAYLERNRPDLILLDINMPEMDGFEVLAKMREDEKYASIPVIFLTAENNAETETHCFQAGAIDFIGKPFIPDVLISRVERTLELEAYHTRLETMVDEQAKVITSRTRKISELQEKVIMGMANLIESRDGSTGKHVKNTQRYVQMISTELLRRGMFADVLDEEYAQNLVKAAPLHDVGKIKISDSVLQKPGRLTEEEFDQMKKHTSYSESIVQNIQRDFVGNKFHLVHALWQLQTCLMHFTRNDATSHQFVQLRKWLK